MRIKWDSKKSNWLKNHSKRKTSFEEAKIILEDPSSEIGGELKSLDPEQHYSVGLASNGIMVTLIYEYRYDGDGIYIWLVTLWKTTKEEIKRLSNV